VFAERDFNSIQNGWQIRHYLIGPETKHAKAVALQPSRAARIMGGLLCFAVLASVNLDHQPRRQANEIGKIRSQRKSAAKAQAVDLFAPKRLPKFLFSVRYIGAELA
jgi:hypothetical protein